MVAHQRSIPDRDDEMERTMTTMMNQTNDLRPLLDDELDAIRRRRQDER